MRKTPVMARMLAVISIISLSVTIAHAGGGAGSGGPVIEGYQCYILEQTVNQSHVVTLLDQFGTREHVRIGNGRLLCAPASATFERGPEAGEFDAVFGGDHLKCYDISPLVRGPRANVELEDPLDIETARVGAPVFFCSFSFKTVQP